MVGLIALVIASRGIDPDATFIVEDLAAQTMKFDLAFCPVRLRDSRSSEPLYVLFPDFTSLVGRKRSADQVSSMAIWVTGRMPAAMRASQPMSRVISVFMFELFFG